MFSPPRWFERAVARRDGLSPGPRPRPRKVAIRVPPARSPGIRPQVVRSTLAPGRDQIAEAARLRRQPGGSRAMGLFTGPAEEGRSPHDPVNIAGPGFKADPFPFH